MEETKTLNETFKFLFDSKQYCDVTFVVHGKEIEAHKLVVTFRSSVIKAMVESDLARKDGKHLINDPEITFEDFKNFLEFLYTDSCKIDEENVAKMMHLSNFYNVKYLAEKCAEYIKSLLPIDVNALKYLELGNLYSEICPLFDICMPEIQKRIIDYGLEIRIKNCIQWFSPELALKIVQKCPRDKNFTENFLFERIFEWAIKVKYGCIDEENLRAVFEPLIPYIKFENLKLLTLATTVRDNKLIEDATLLDAMSKAIKNGIGEYSERSSSSSSSSMSDIICDLDLPSHNRRGSRLLSA